MLQRLQRIFHGFGVVEQLPTKACFQTGCRFDGVAQVRDLLAVRGQAVRRDLFRIGVARHLQKCAIVCMHLQHGAQIRQRPEIGSGVS